MARDLLAALTSQVLVSDGAMGTMLAAQGVTVRNSSEANLTHPDIVAGIHRTHQQVGAQVFRTNTFAASPLMLARAGLADDATRIWSEGVRICRGAVGPDALVFAACGPTGGLLEPLGDLTPDEVRAAYHRQFETMLGPDVDAVLLEGFEALEEAEVAVSALRDLDPTVPLAVTLSFSLPVGRTFMGVDGEAAARRLGALNVQIIGAGCGIPEGLEIAFRQMSQATDLPLMAQPNAGMPSLQGGVPQHSMTPLEMGRLAARLIGYGARIVGGCCGTTPDHVAQVARAASAAP